MAISKKKKDALYSEVHSDIMDARIEIAKAMTDEHVSAIAQVRIDNILSALTIDAPKNAINIFE
jgi:hypothetical protein